MMQGDAYSVPVVIKAKDGTVITPEMATRVEITIGHLTRQWPGVITFNEDTLAWEFPLTQQQSFRLSQGKQKTQVRVAFSNGWVVGGDGTDVRVLKSESKSIFPAAAQQEKAANIAFGAIFAEIGAITVVLGAGLPEMSSTTKGQYLTNDGETAGWADVPREIMYVNFTQEADGKWSADKNWHDAAAVIETGGVVYANPTDRGVYPLTIYDASYYYMTFSVITIMLLEQGFYLVQSTLRWDQDDRVEERNEPGPVLMYAPQTLTAAEQAQARINIGAGTPYTLPIASPTQLGGVKPVAKTDAMTQSIGVDVTGGLYVEPSKVYYIDLEGAYPDYTCPVAMADIKAAYDAGKVLECRCAMGEYTATLPLFIPMPDFNAWIFSGSGALNTPPLNFAAQSLTIAVTSDGVKASNTRLAKMGDIPTVPTALPNPNALTITIGDNVVSYDGSETRVITIPASGGSGGETWELINTFEVAEADAARVIKIDKDSNGNTFSLKEFAFSANTNSTKTDGNVYGWFCVNGKGTYNSGLGGFQTNYVRHPSSGAAIVNDVIGRALPFGLVYDQSTGRKAVEGIVATSVTEVHEVELAGYQSAENLLYGTFSLWGVRK